MSRLPITFNSWLLWHIHLRPHRQLASSRITAWGGLFYANKYKCFDCLEYQILDASLIRHLNATMPNLRPGYRVKIIDGNAIAFGIASWAIPATEHRLYVC